MNILVINAGSSSLKYQLIDTQNEKLLAKGIVERIGDASRDAELIHKPQGKDVVNIDTPCDDHIKAMKLVLESLVHPQHGVIKNMDEIGAVGHRIVHGGESFSGSVIIDDQVIAAIKENADLAPLHNPANLMGISACKNVMPDTPMVAVFDTAFHQTMPKHAYLYALPYKYYQQYKIRRYGFHGTSHGYVCKRAAAIVGRPIEELKIITCHLGNGGSITAVKNGKSMDTSMGLTPLEGVVMGTRSGDIDPAIFPVLMEKEGLTAREVEDVLNRQSGLLGVSNNISSDMRDIESAAASGDDFAKTALDMFAYRVRKYIGAYAAAMGGLDVLVFTAGIGENMRNVRLRCVEGLEFLGININKERNEVRGGEHIVSNDGAKVQVLVVETDEEMVIARDTLALVGEK